MRRLTGIFRSQISYKIILPYLALTLLVMLVGAAISLALAAASWQERLNSQLVQVGRNTTEALVQRERDHLFFLQQIAFAQENPAIDAPPIAEAFTDENPEVLEQALRPFYDTGVEMVSLNFDRMIAFDTNGTAIVDWLRVAEDRDIEPRLIRGTDLAQVEGVQSIIEGELVDGNDKFSNLIIFQPDPQPYFYTAVPVKQGNENVGGVLIAIKLDRLLRAIEQSSQSVITSVYDLEGRAIGSTVLRRDSDLATFAMPPEALNQLQEGRAESVFNQVDVPQRQIEYQLAYSPLVIAERQVGYFSVGLSLDFQVQSVSLSRNVIIVITMALTIGAVLLGYWIARQITRSLSTLVSGAEAITAGNLEHRVTVKSKDELGRLAVSFNQMTEHLLRLYRTSREFSQTIKVDTILGITQQTIRSLEPETDIFVLLNERGNWSYRLAPEGTTTVQALRYTEIKPTDETLQWLIQNTEPYLIDVDDEPHLASLGLAESHFQSLLFTPLLLQNKVIGILIFAHTSPDVFKGSLEPTIEAVANMASSVLYNAILFDRVHEESSERRAILQSIADGVVVCDTEGNIVMMNHTAEYMLKLPDWHTRNLNFSSISLERVHIHRDLFGQEQPDLEHYQIGNTILTLSSAPVITEDGRTVGEVFVLHDISAEAAIDQAKTDFIATISHELRTPLTVITGYVELLLRGLVGDVNEEQSDLLRQVRQRAEHMNNLVKNVVLVASIESNTLQTDLEPQDLGEAIEQVLSPIRSTFSTKNIEVEITIPDDLPPVMADREQLRSVLAQLFDNAHRYTQTGRVIIHVSYQDSKVQLDVVDSGPGIPTEEFDRLFTRFHRVAGNSSPERGSGLGLAIARQLVERQGGRVWAQSEVGHGSTFSIELPVANGQVDAVIEP
ncbi:MAG: ATP-binding protein [Chloroflexota bacterium]